MKAEKITIATTEMVSISAGNCKKMLATLASSKITTPTNINLPSPDKSRLIDVASVAIVPKTAAVPPKANITSCVPLLMPSTWPNRRDSIMPIKKVKSSSRPTPKEVSLFFSMAYIKPKAPAKKIIMVMNGLVAMTLLMPLYIPKAAPSTVGISEMANSQ